MSEKHDNNSERRRFVSNMIDYNSIANRNAEDRMVNRREKISVSDAVAHSEKNKRATSHGTRRVALKRTPNMSGRAEKTPGRTEEIKKRQLSEDERRRKIELKKKKERIRKQQFRAAMILLIISAMAVVLLFMTPLFNIKEIKLVGNNVVTKEIIEEKIGDMIGANLFGTRKSVIRKKMFEIAQISDVKVDKDMFPPSITLTIEESTPAAYFLSGNTIVVINSELKVIDDKGEFDIEVVPSLSGVSVQSYKLNKAIKTESEEKDEILSTLLSALEKTGVLKDVTYIGLDDISNIKFNYANRIDVMCGSQLELERKIRMFKEAITSESVSANAIGTVDLSVPGKAVYTP